MAAQYKLSDGTDTVDLLPTIENEFMPVVGGLGPSNQTLDLELAQVPGIYGGQVQAIHYPPILETWKLQIIPDDWDDAAAKYQTLIRLLRKSALFRLPSARWQKEPVYIIAQASTETSPRYSQVVGMSSYSFPDIFRPEFDSGDFLADLVFSLMREPVYRDTIPGTVPASLLTMGDKDARPAGLERIAGVGDSSGLGFSSELAQLGSYAGKLYVDGGSGQAGWRDRPSVDQTEATVEFVLSLAEIDIPDTSLFYLALVEDEGTANKPWYLILKKDGVNFEISVGTIDDSPSPSATLGDYVVVDGDRVKVYWKRSTGPGNDDGICTVYINDIQQGTVTNEDTDTLTFDMIEIGAPLTISSDVSGTFGIDNLKIDYGGDGTVWDKVFDWEPADDLVAVGNLRQSGQISHVFNYDLTATAYSANLRWQKDWTLFEVASSTVAVGDQIYIGAEDAPFWNSIFDLSVPDWEITVKVEYYNGAWVTADGPVWDSGPLYTDGGLWPISFSQNARDWSKVAINGVTAYWIRIEVLTVTSSTTQPTVSAEVFAAHDRFIEITAGDLPGDVEALLLLRMYNGASDNIDGTGWVALGKKSRGLEYFNPTISISDVPNSPGWSFAEGTDTSAVSRVYAPDEKGSLATFATNQTLIDRVTLSISTEEFKEGFEGSYRLYMWAYQNGGAAGDVSVRAKVKTHAVMTGPKVTMNALAKNELLDLGRFEFYPSQILADEEVLFEDLEVVLQASSSNGATPDLYMYQLILLPLDEAACVVSWDALENQLLGDGDGVALDSGIVRYGANEFRWEGPAGDPVQPTQPWLTMGLPIVLEPNRCSRIYFIQGGHDANYDGFNAVPGAVLLVDAKIVSRWFNLRGAD